MFKFIGLLLVSTSLFGGTPDVKTYIPEQAKLQIVTLRAEYKKFWPQHPRPELLASLVEHESCVSLTHSRCWSPTSKLKTSREEGAGVGQITRAYRTDGTLRFDALSELRNKHESLSELTWSNVYQRPDLQFRALVLKSRDNYNYLSMVTSPTERLNFADAAYNGGMSGVQNERRACSLKSGCDPQKWFGHVENVCLKSKAPLYGARSACDINRHHVKDVVLTRSGKYKPYFPKSPPQVEKPKPKIVFKPKVSILNSFITYMKEVFL